MTSSLIDLVNIRPFESSDTHFLLDSIIQSLSKYTESVFKGMHTYDVHKHIELLALYALNRIDTYSVFIACHRNNPDRIIAYIVADPVDNHILFQYTKYDYRKMGIQKNLLLPLVVDDEKPITVNWPTKEMLKLVKANKASIINKLLEKLINED